MKYNFNYSVEVEEFNIDYMASDFKQIQEAEITF